MVIDFWSIVGSNSVLDGTEVDAALDGILERLDELTPDELIEFRNGLNEALYRIDRRDLAEVPVLLPGGTRFSQTSDHFLYARCACVLTGEETFDDVLLTGAGFDHFVAPFAQRAERLLYLVPELYRAKTGTSMTLQDAFPVDSMSNLEGWPD
jgi:hypothetical protein